MIKIRKDDAVYDIHDVLARVLNGQMLTEGERYLLVEAVTPAIKPIKRPKRYAQWLELAVDAKHERFMLRNILKHTDWFITSNGFVSHIVRGDLVTADFNLDVMEGAESNRLATVVIGEVLRLSSSPLRTIAHTEQIYFAGRICTLITWGDGGQSVVNSQYWLNALNGRGLKEFNFYQTGEKSPVLLDCLAGDTKALVMPIKM